jgi:polyphosphate glucokinase
MNILGIDIGGSAFKGAPVNTKTGKLLAERLRVEISSPCSLKEGMAAAREIARHFKWKGPVGLGFPGIIVGDKIGPVGNLGSNWEGQNGAAVFRRATGCRVKLYNDADAAGLAEMKFGAGRGHQGSVLMLTFGTGIGSALFYRGQLFPNAEMGWVPWRGKQPFERFASAAVRKRQDLSWHEWADRVNVYLAVIERILCPDMIIIGGGVSKKSGEFLKYIKARAKVVPAKLHNDAGIVGAALAWEHVDSH